MTRLRPILMTSVATVAGHFPLVLVTGAGAEARNSIGIVLVTGMLISTFFTLIVVPSIYMLISSRKARHADPASPHAAHHQPGGSLNGTHIHTRPPIVPA